MFKKTVRLLPLLISLAMIFAAFAFNGKIVKSENNENFFGGYYDIISGEGVIKGEKNFPSAFKKVTVSGGDLTAALQLKKSGVIVTENSVTIKNVTGLTAGTTYTLTLSADAGEIISDFLCITKLIKTAADVKVLDVTGETTEIGVYYVLAGDITLAAGEENAHVGVTKQWDNYAGFKGVFDGNGYGITFTCKDKGFFGQILPGAVIKNLAFKNVDFYADGKGNKPILAYAPKLNSKNRARVENCYFHTAKGGNCCGAIFDSGTNARYLAVENVVIDFEGAFGSGEYNEAAGLGLGALVGWDSDWAKGDRDSLFKNVFCITSYPMSLYHYEKYNPYNGNYNAPLYVSESDYKNGWITGYAENDGVKQDFSHGVKVYNGVKRYKNYSAMKADDKNDYSSFNSACWDLSLGVPLWSGRKSESTGMFFETEGISSDKSITLTLGKTPTAKAYFGAFGIKINSEVSYELLETGGEIEVAAADGELTITAVKPGKSKIRVYTEYNETLYERVMTVKVVENENGGDTKNDEESKGCGSVTAIFNGFFGGGAAIAACFAVVRLKRRRRGECLRR